MTQSGSMDQWDNQQLVSQRTPCRSYFSLEFIKNLINDKSKHKTISVLFVLNFPGTSQLFITCISL